jgi:hypothetical protein
MFEQPPETGGPAFRIPGSPDRVESETDAKDSPGEPVSNSMATEIEENPSHDHGYDCGRGRVCRSRRDQSQTCGYNPGNLHRISGTDRKTTEDFAFRRQGCPIPVCGQLRKRAVGTS